MHIIVVTKKILVRSSLTKNSSGSLWEMIGLVLFVVLILVATWWATRWLARRANIGTTSRNIKVIETMPLGKEKFLSIVEVAGSYYLIGVSAQSIQLIAMIDNPDDLSKQVASTPTFDRVYKFIKQKGKLEDDGKQAKGQTDNGSKK